MVQRLSQEYILSIKFTRALEREQLLIKKYEEILKNLKNSDISRMMDEFRIVGREHIKLLKDKMIKLNIQG